jgi:hypothetical protein
MSNMLSSLTAWQASDIYLLACFCEKAGKAERGLVVTKSCAIVARAQNPSAIDVLGVHWLNERNLRLFDYIELK